MSYRRRCLSAAAAGLLVVLPQYALAGPTAITCGMVITHNTVLRADLSGCAGDGLVVATDGITLDLGQHTIAGDSVPNASGGVDVGVRLTGRHGVRVLNGVVRGFDRGLLIDGGGANALTRLTATGHVRGGLVTLDSRDNVLQGNRSYGNGAGIGLIGGAGNRVRRNLVYRNREVGVSVGHSDANLVRGNTVRDNGDNLIVNGSDNLVDRNHIRHASGCPDGCGYDISLELGQRNTIRDNIVEGGPVDGIRVSAFDPDIPTVDNAVIGNVVRSVGRDGIAVGTEGDFPTTGTVVARNTVIRSGADGIHVLSPVTTISGNRALRNGALGIDAVPGVRDGGGNIARTNDNPIQCVNVRCSS